MTLPKVSSKCSVILIIGFERFYFIFMNIYNLRKIFDQ